VFEKVSPQEGIQIDCSRGISSVGLDDHWKSLPIEIFYSVLFYSVLTWGLPSEGWHHHSAVETLLGPSGSWEERMSTTVLLFLFWL